LALHRALFIKASRTVKDLFSELQQLQKLLPQSPPEQTFSRAGAQNSAMQSAQIVQINRNYLKDPLIAAKLFRVLGTSSHVFQSSIEDS
jgi:hypothetical protein